MSQHYKNNSITKARVKVFLGWENFNTKGNVAPGRRDQNILSKVWTGHNRSSITLSVARNTPTLTNPTRQSLSALPFEPAKTGDTFGPTFSNHVFKLEIQVPPSMAGKVVHLLWDSNSEVLVLSEDGCARQGMAGGDHWARRADYPLYNGQIVTGGEKLTLYLEIACNGLFGAGRGGQIEPPDMNRRYELDECCLAVFDPTAWGVLNDLTVLSGLVDELPEEARKARALHVANEVINVVNLSEPETFQRGRDVASAFFGEVNGSGQSTVCAMLHSHIDLAWLWPMASTPAKGARTFATHLRLMDVYKDCLFVQSQAQLYEWVKEGHPMLWEEICARVKEGRFVPVGATWVEMDCNIPSGESLVRQFLLGQRFFEKEFGKRCREFWLPDTFGYSAQLPQIMKGCGVDRFLTQKLSWNTFNKFPHSSFVWEGLDGSRVLAHMPPADTYNAQGVPDEVMRTAHANKDAATVNSAVMLVGHGDGGGGASPAMLESINRMKDLDGVPKVEYATPDRFFENLEKVQDDLPRWVGELYFELHRGTFTSQANTKKSNRQCEHSLHDVEVFSSLALVVASSVGNSFAYPREMLLSCWKLVLKNCFHDTLPGTCIAQVYEETARDYAYVFEHCHKAMDVAFASLSESILTACGTLRAGKRAFESLDGDKMAMSENSSPGVKRRKPADGNPLSLSAITNGVTDIMAPLALINRSTGWQSLRDRPLVVDIDIPPDVLGSELFTQKKKDSTNKLHSLANGNGFVAPPSASVVALRSRPEGLGILTKPDFVSAEEVSSVVRPTRIESRKSPDGTEYILSNGLVEATLSSCGRVKSLVLFSEGGGRREALAQEPADEDARSQGGNRLVIYDDIAQFWCGWDTEVYAFEKKYEVGAAERCTVVDDGPLQVSLHLQYPPTKAGSRVEQYVILRAESQRLDFKTHVDWRESRKILRVLFNTQVRSPRASYESQFGYVSRPTTFNHSWEIAMFESVGHQYCDLSEHNFGLALLNDCKYGYSVRDSTMRLSLLRAPKSPDDTADMGSHTMVYSLLPHWGAFPSLLVLEEAANLNVPPIIQPMRLTQGSDAKVGEVRCMFEMTADVKRQGLDTVMISAVKRAEKNEKDLVVRMYEAMGGRGTATLRCPVGMKVKRVRLCNMLEDECMTDDNDSEQLEAVYADDRTDVSIPFTPFQIQTVTIEFV
eukprot:GFKZ01015775.1.p1 GENE.GFKZ01015775.1~~GFKZ01015775.1.p1  ORF type:complete len:1183 (-),score=165.02 GFKZ01015775.1:2165-5713(-)